MEPRRLWGYDWSDKVHSTQMKYADISRIGKVFGNTKSNNSFNWNGENSDEDRHKAATKLVDHVIATRARLIKQGKITDDEPITLIGHSHGGNVSIEAANMLIEKHGYKAEQFNIIALNTPREHDITSWYSGVKLYSVNTVNDLVQKFGGDGSSQENSSSGPITVLNADAKILYEDQLSSDSISTPPGVYPSIKAETNHNGWHPKNIDEWLPMLKKKI